jgi:hypothetical protein
MFVSESCYCHVQQVFQRSRILYFAKLQYMRKIYCLEQFRRVHPSYYYLEISFLPAAFFKSHPAGNGRKLIIQLPVTTVL